MNQIFWILSVVLVGDVHISALSDAMHRMVAGAILLRRSIYQCVVLGEGYAISHHDIHQEQLASGVLLVTVRMGVQSLRGKVRSPTPKAMRPCIAPIKS